VCRPRPGWPGLGLDCFAERLVQAGKHKWPN
jgi:hypothetical protein